MAKGHPPENTAEVTKVINQRDNISDKKEDSFISLLQDTYTLEWWLLCQVLVFFFLKQV